jgi:hypothetical protein
MQCGRVEKATLGVFALPQKQGRVLIPQGPRDLFDGKTMAVAGFAN